MPFPHSNGFIANYFQKEKLHILTSVFFDSLNEKKIEYSIISNLIFIATILNFKKQQFASNTTANGKASKIKTIK